MRSVWFLFSDGGKLTVQPSQRELLEYAQDILEEKGGITPQTAPSRSGQAEAVGVVLISLAAIALIIVVMWHTVGNEQVDYTAFRENIAQYQNVVELIESGGIDTRGVTTGLVALPKEYAKLSQSGAVLIYANESGTDVFFFRKHELSGGFSGFVYTANEKKWGYAVSD